MQKWCELGDSYTLDLAQGRKSIPVNEGILRALRPFERLRRDDEQRRARMKALVVDDSAVMRKVVIGALSRADITDVDQAADGQEAVNACKEGDYGLILMDWNMPNMLGIDAVKAIRALGNKTPIIMVTTEAEKSRVVEALKAGANNYIIKPFEPATIVEKIKAVLESA